MKADDWFFTVEELEDLINESERLQGLIQQQKREQAAFEKGVEVGKRLAEHQELAY